MLIGHDTVQSAM